MHTSEVEASSQGCVAVTTIYLQNIFITPRGTVFPLVVSAVSSHPFWLRVPQPQATAQLLSVSVDLHIQDTSHT